MQASVSKLLKKDIFGTITLLRHGLRPVIVRDTREARRWARPVARSLMRREARALRATDGIAGTPQLVETTADSIVRSYLDGTAMHIARPADGAYFRAARRLLRQLHRRGIVHNDLAKETNWLVSRDGSPAIVDFQLACRFRRRGKLYRLLAYEDLRHLLKHKKTHYLGDLRPREQQMVETRSWPSLLWRHTGKRLYLLATRRLLRWQDREGAADRGESGG